ncbi:hypothetical protein H0E87_004651 [Populus deltoides]|uniref:Uncharacterized protein n=1 Tax=Populus deltoides TaxID=3696 RepID=A0A8T2ZFJ9_POPDE|nr:hypothetical protein H0E87_004651 [Populus deltoides]
MLTLALVIKGAPKQFDMGAYSLHDNILAELDPTDNNLDSNSHAISFNKTVPVDHTLDFTAKSGDRSFIPDVLAALTPSPSKQNPLLRKAPLGQRAHMGASN